MKGQVRIDQIFAFICVDDDGTEGIPAISTPIGVMPLVGADEARIESLRKYAEQISRDMGKKVTLVKFTNRIEMEVLNDPS
jgi:hypothetical protein